ncbi:diguanylate cyclase (GGDEF)-like protein/PAS domain S-box-containing protein [Streptacidiphilus sp. MAP12-16]|uniref:diguanylate cyclase domain-containing protein n=1 Tax=Streptacidiphilus sp. MAP12-16 TaxID=3156300 RepID=UPI0035135F7D
MDPESEPYVRLATLRTLHRIVADLNAARSLAGTLQAVVEGAVTGLGFESAVVNLVRPDGDLVVAAVWDCGEYGETDSGIDSLLGQIGSRESWNRLMNVGDVWGSLVFVPHERSWARSPDIPSWGGSGGGELVPVGPSEAVPWHPDDLLLAPMHSLGGELLGVLSVDRPRSGRRPGQWTRESLEMFSQQAGIAISNARLRAEMQRALVRLEREQQTLRASEESFRQAFEYAPSGMAITELHGAQRGKLTRVNDALCRLLGRPRAALQRQSFEDLVHPEDEGLLRRVSAENGRAEVRLARRDGGYLWVYLRNSVVADTEEGARFLLTHIEDIEDRKRHELQLAHRASHDALTGLPNAAELRARLRLRLCEEPQVADDGRQAIQAAAGSGPGALGTFDTGGHSYNLSPYGGPFDGGFEHVHAVLPDDPAAELRGGRGLAVLFCDLDGFKSINDRFGHGAGDAVLIEVARRLQHVVREGDTVARLGGDEFVVLADGVGRDEAKDLAGRLRTAIIPPMRVDDRTVRVGVSLGIGWAGCGMSIDEVLHTADERMYLEKRARAGAAAAGTRPPGNGNRSHRRAG